MEPAGSGATWTGSPKGVFAERKHHKPRLVLNNFTAGVREREDENRTIVAGHRDDVEGVMKNTGIFVLSGRGLNRHKRQLDFRPSSCANRAFPVFE